MHRILAGFALPIMGIHGLTHWARVLENGLALAAKTGANRDVVTLFAVFHDARRRNEGRDSGHGMRGAQLAMELREDHIDLTDKEFELLAEACAYHTNGRTQADLTVRCCWDADRLDLWRVGTIPRDELLCTHAAMDEDFKRWAMNRSQSLFTPDIVRNEWLPLAEGRR